MQKLDVGLVNGRSALWAAAAVIVLAAVAVVWVAGRPSDDGDRLAEVAARGAGVMPFDLERTTHRFQPRADGGFQSVVADDRGDSEQIDLIRGHLRAEAKRFRDGDFGDPAAIHGEDMPGLAELTEGVERIDVRYEDAPAGGRIWYLTNEAVLVEAIHDWFEAQLTDHGPHAQRPRRLRRPVIAEMAVRYNILELNAMPRSAGYRPRPPRMIR